MPRLENWCMQYTGRLSGNVYDHPRFDDGEFVTTTEIVMYNEDNKEFHTKSGSSYTLGP